jgi:hypothetical protein
MAEGDGKVMAVLTNYAMCGQVNFDSGGHAFKVSLVSDAAIDPLAWHPIASLTKHDGDNYADADIGNQSVGSNGGASYFNGDNVTWVALGAPSSPTTFAVLWDDSLAGDDVLAVWEITTQSNGGDYTISWDISLGDKNIVVFSIPA